MAVEEFLSLRSGVLDCLVCTLCRSVVGGV